MFDDADIDFTLEGLLAGKFRASGQTCVCPNRVYVQDSIHDMFVSRVLETLKGKMVGGDPTEASTTLGPLISPKAVDKVCRLVQDACEKGATVLMGGPSKYEQKHNFYPATILTNMSLSMHATQEEWFGPVIAFYSFKTEQDLYDMANDSNVGLAAYVYTQNISRAWRAAELLETGMVGINTGMVSDAAAPFGGVKHSGFGREGGKVGIEEFQVSKVSKLTYSA